MRLKFETAYRGLLLLLCVSLAWGLWAASSQPATNKTAEAMGTNAAASGLIAKVSNERYLTFHLDRIPVLRDYTFLGEPIWKYVASLIYVLLAFYTAKLLDVISLVWLKKLALRTTTKVDDILLELLHGPVKIVVFIIFLH